MSKSSRANSQMKDHIEGIRTKLYNFIKDSDYSHPAIVQCCLDIGLDPEELKAKDLTDFIDKGISHELSQVRWNHYEIKRKSKLETVINELINRRANFRQSPKLAETSISKENSGYSYTPNNISPTPVDLWKKRKSFEATRLQHIMKVQDKLEQLELNHEKKRFKAQELIQAKIERAVKDKADLNKQKQSKLKLQDVKIQQIREQKRKELEEYEKREVKKQLERARNLSERTERRSVSMQNTKSYISRSIMSREDEDYELICEKLLRFNNKLNQSIERSFRHKEKKASGGYLLYNKASRLKSFKIQKERENEENRIKLIIEIQQDLAQKEKNKNQLIANKTTQHSTKYNYKKQKAEKERMKLEEELKMRQKALVKKENYKLSFMKQAEEEKSQSISIWSERLNLKKFDQKENLQKQHRMKEKLREKVLSKHKKTDMLISWLKLNKEKNQQDNQMKEIEIRRRRAKSADRVARTRHSFVKPKRRQVESDDENY